MDTMARPVLAVQGVKKYYPGVRALKGVDLELRAGTVTALVGENGAGKSTVIRILAGIEQPTSGSLLLRGEPVEFHSPSQSQSAGISVVSQEFRLVPQLAVYENVFLGQELGRGPFVDARSAIARTRELLGEFGLEIDPKDRVEMLSIGDQQMVEIARALGRDFEVIVFDEPTAALNRAEVLKLLRLIDDLRARGKAILYVSHHLDEIMDIADRVVVFRDGRNVAELETANASAQEIVSHMLGRELESMEAQASVEPRSTDAAPILSVRGLRTVRVPHEIELDVRPGEIVGVAGLIGSGRAELLSAVFGELHHTGSVNVGGRPVKKRGARAAISSGIFLLPEDRKAAGIFPHLSVLENLITGPTGRPQSGLGRFLPIARRELGVYAGAKNDLDIRVDRPQQLIGNLSGGNQQKVLFGRAVGADCRVLLLNEPTRGVDVGAKADIYRIVRELADRGVAVIVSSSDAPELVTLSDRCIVFQKGKIVKEIERAELTEDAILAASIGSGEQVVS